MRTWSSAQWQFRAGRMPCGKPSTMRGSIILASSALVLACSDASEHSQSSDGPLCPSQVTSEDALHIVQFDTKGDQLALVTSDGRVLGWGSGSRGDGSPTPEPEAEPTFATGINCARQVAVGGEHACALLLDGRIVCWGSNFQMELGTVGPHTRVPQLVVGVSSATQVDCSFWRTGMVSLEGTVSTWGLPPGDCCLAGSAAPQVQPLSNAIMLTMSGHVCSVSREGLPLCLGRNSCGQLGNGSMETSASAVQPIGLDRVLSVDVGPEATCAVAASGQVFCWGEVLHDGDPAEFPCDPVPRQLAELPPASAVSVGGSHACALTLGGDVWCWGGNLYGQLGRDGPFGGGGPGRVAGLPAPARSIAVGAFHSCALIGDVDVWCWGQNYSLQYGFVATGGPTPVRVPLPL